MYLPSHKDPLGENTFRQENMETVSASLDRTWHFAQFRDELADEFPLGAVK
jgi:hypothetical protein